VAGRIRIDLGEVEDLPEHAQPLAHALGREPCGRPPRYLSTDVARGEPARVSLRQW
jgi:hypothetical protein